MANLKYKIATLLAGLNTAIKDWKILCSGQLPEYEILMTSHRLEKGLLIENPRKLWGWDKAKRLYALIHITKDLYSKQTAEAVLSAYLLKKKASKDIEEKKAYADFMAETKFQIENNELGGTQLVTKQNFKSSDIELIETLFKTRHSTRNFLSDEIPKEKLYKAINLALKCPSACNRQPFKVYAVNSIDKVLNISKNLGYSGSMFLFITVPINAYTIGEMNDWIVSPSIFVGYLTLSLHAMGIGSCVVRKDLVVETEYNKAVRKFCKIPKNEKLIIELAIGLYPETYTAPISNRKSAEDIMVLCTQTSDH